VAPSTQPSVVPAAAQGEGKGLDPMLLVAGVVAAVAVFCLLLIGSRRTTD
jgi:hypothetical protein